MERRTNPIIAKYTSMIMTAMKARHTVKANTLKLIKATMMEYVTGKGNPVLDEAAEVTILKKMLKERQDNIETYTAAGRTDLAEKEQHEANIIADLLPPPITEDEVNNVIGSYIENYGDITKATMGAAIKYVKSMLPTVEGKMVADLVKGKIKE